MKKKWIFNIWEPRKKVEGLKDAFTRERKTSQILFELDEENEYIKFKVNKEEGYIKISDIIRAWIQGR